MLGPDQVPEEDRLAYEYYWRNPASLEALSQDVLHYLESRNVQTSLNTEIERLVRSDLDLHPVVLQGLLEQENSDAFKEAILSLEKKIESQTYAGTIEGLLEDQVDDNEERFDLTPRRPKIDENKIKLRSDNRQKPRDWRESYRYKTNT